MYVAILVGAIVATFPRGAAAAAIAYVTQPASNSVAALDVTQARLLAMIAVGEEPVGLVAAKDGRTVYVANRATHSVTVVRTATNTVRDTIVIPPPEPSGEPPFLPRKITIAPDGHRLALSLDWPDGCPWDPVLGTVDLATGAVGIINPNVGEGQVEDLVFLDDGSLCLAVAGGCSDSSFYPGLAVEPRSPGSRWAFLPLFERQTPVSVGDIVANADSAYVAVASDNTVQAIDLRALHRAERSVTPIAVGVRPRGLALHHGTLYVVNACGREVTCGGPGSVSLVDTVTLAVTAEIRVDRGAQDIALSADGLTAFVTNTDAGTVSIIDTATREVMATLQVAEPAQIALVDVPPCVDCNQDGVVTIDDIVTLVPIAMGTMGPTACPAADHRQTGSVTVDAILYAVEDALNGCVAK